MRPLARERSRATIRKLPTSFALEAEQVDRLQEIAGRLLRDAPGYRKAVEELGAASEQAELSPACQAMMK